MKNLFSIVTTATVILFLVSCSNDSEFNEINIPATKTESVMQIAPAGNLNITSYEFSGTVEKTVNDTVFVVASTDDPLVDVMIKIPRENRDTIFMDNVPVTIGASLKQLGDPGKGWKFRIKS